MGNTTIIELNHDRWQEIERNRAAFVDAILKQMLRGDVDELPSGRVVAFFPRDEVPIHRAWKRWRQKWGKR